MRDVAITMLQAQWFQWDRVNLKNGDVETTLVQGALRPTIWGAYEYIFPEEALPEVLSIIGRTDPGGSVENHKIGVYFVRKMFGCRKIPKKIWKEAAKIPSTMSIEGTHRGLGNCIIPGVAYHIIGIKDDAREEWEDIGYKQEML